MSVKTVAIMGPTGSGKSTFINSLVPSGIGSCSGIRVGHTLQSETSKVQPIELDNGNGLSFKLVDTPGFDDSREGITDIDVLSMIATFLLEEEKRSTLAGLIYMHRISDTRMGGTARRNLKMFHKLCGPNSLKNVVIITTMWDKVTPGEGKRRERELQSSETLFKPLLDGGAAMRRHDGTRTSALGIINHLLHMQDHATTQIAQELLYEKKGLEETAAGAEIQKELRTIMQKHAADIKSFEEELKSATAVSTKEEIALQKKELEQSVNKLNQQIEDLKRRSGANETYFLPSKGRMTHPASLQSPVRASSLDFSHYPSRGIEVYAPHDFRGYPYHRNDPMCGRFIPPPASCLLVPQAAYIANCTELLHLADRVPKIRKVTPTRDDFLSHTSAWTSNFASIIGKSINNAQYGIAVLGSMSHSRNQRQLQDLASRFLNTTKDIERDWRNSCATMEKMYGEYQAALHAEQRTTLITLAFGGRRKYLNIFQAITRVMRLVLVDLNSAIEWWTSINVRVGTWGDVAPQPMSGHGFNDYMRGEVKAVIHALGSYREACQNVSQELHGIQATLLSATDRRIAVTSYRSRLKRSRHPRFQPSSFGSKGVDSSITL